MMVDSMIIVFYFSNFYMYDFFMADLLVKGTVSWDRYKTFQLKIRGASEKFKN